MSTFSSWSKIGLAAVAAGGVIACSSENQRIACPTDEAGVSQQVGGFPANWRRLDGILGAWVFEAESYQQLAYSGFNLNYGRLEILDGKFLNGRPKRGTVIFLERIETRRAFYVCVDEKGTQDQGSSASSTAPTPTNAS